MAKTPVVRTASPTCFKINVLIKSSTKYSITQNVKLKPFSFYIV